MTSLVVETGFQGFEFLGGRLKLVEEPMSMLKEDNMDLEIRKIQKLQVEERQRQALLGQHRRMVADFLERNGFQDVNHNAVMQISCLGFRSYEAPLHKAAKENDEIMLRLLVTFGADPYQKDSRGKNVFRCPEAGYLARTRAHYGSGFH